MRYTHACCTRRGTGKSEVVEEEVEPLASAVVAATPLVAAQPIASVDQQSSAGQTRQGARRTGRFGQKASAGSGQLTLAGVPPYEYATRHVNSLAHPQEINRGEGIVRLVFCLPGKLDCAHCTPMSAASAAAACASQLKREIAGPRYG